MKITFILALASLGLAEIDRRKSFANFHRNQPKYVRTTEPVESSVNQALRQDFYMKKMIKMIKNMEKNHKNGQNSGFDNGRYHRLMKQAMLTTEKYVRRRQKY